MNQKREALKAAFPLTLPVLAGFSFLGIAYGVLMNSKGFPFWYPLLISLTVFAGSMQFVLVNLLVSAFDPLAALAMTLMINARHLFYGLSMLEKYRDAGPLRPYLIFGMCDESFSINCSAKPPEGVDPNWFMFFVTLLCHGYWVLGSAAGGILGEFIPFDTTGIDFAMTALFVVIFLNQWQEQREHLPALAGVGLSVACLLLFGSENFIIPSMAAILVALTLLRGRLSQEKEVG